MEPSIRTISIIDAATTSPFVQLSMVPLLTLTAYYAPAGHRATWFALMASLMNLAPQAGARCPECGNATVIHKDGCDFCTACGYVGACG